MWYQLNQLEISFSLAHMKYMCKSIKKCVEHMPSLAFGLTLCMYISSSRKYLLSKCCMCESTISRNHRCPTGRQTILKKFTTEQKPVFGYFHDLLHIHSLKSLTLYLSAPPTVPNLVMKFTLLSNFCICLFPHQQQKYFPNGLPLN